MFACAPYVTPSLTVACRELSAVAGDGVLCHKYWNNIPISIYFPA